MSKRIRNIRKIKRFPKSLKKDSFTQKLLLFMFKSIRKSVGSTIKVGDFYIDLFCGLDMTSVYQKFYGTYYSNKEREIITDEARKKEEVRKAIKRLQSMDYININKSQKRAYLTEKGILEFIKFRIHSKKSSWDGKWRIIIFDIPERQRKERDFLRARLKWLGFKELQKSVWIFPYNIKQDLQEVLAICKASDIYGDIRFLTVEKIEDDKDLKKYFNLL